MAEEIVAVVGPQLETRLEPGEVLRGVVAATQQKTFGGSLYAIGVTDRRLLLQQLDRKAQAKDVVSVTPETIEELDLDGAGGDWWTAPAAILDATSLTLGLRLRDSEEVKLTMMRGRGWLLGGESQGDGVAALGEWLASARLR